MKKLFFAVLIFLSTTAQAKTQILGEVKDLSNGNVLFILNSFSRVVSPLGITTSTVEITSNIDVNVEVKNMVNEKVNGVVIYPSIETPYVKIKLVKGKTEKFTFTGINLSSGSEYSAILAHKLTIPGSGDILSGGLGGGDVTIPDVRKMVVFNTASVTLSQIVLNSTITTSNLDDIASYEVFDANGNSLMKVTETIFATVDAITFTKSFIIDLVKYPTASSLTTTSSTGGSQKMKLKSASGISAFIREVLTDETIVIYTDLSGRRETTNWGTEKSLNRDGFISKPEAIEYSIRKPQTIE